MNIKKIIKGIIGIGAVGGIAYVAFKLGESNGEINERFRQKYDGDENEYDFDDDEDGYNLYDEPDDGCVAPAPCEDYWLNEYDKFCTEGNDDNCDNGDHIRNMTLEDLL